MFRVLFIFALCVLAVLPQRVCTCHGVEIGRDAAPAECPDEHDHDCPCLHGGPFGEGLKSAEIPTPPLAFAELLPVTANDAPTSLANSAAVERPPPSPHVPLFLSLLTLRI